MGYCPVFTPFLFERAYPEETEAVRALAADMNESLLAAAAALLVVGERRTEGMLRELEWARRERSDGKGTLGARKIYQWPGLPRAGT